MAIKDYLVVDIAKPVNTYANLTDYFQGRVGDAEAYCKLWIKFGTRPIDMTGKKLRFEGNDPNNTPFIDAGRFDAGDDGDVQLGMITFYFPKGIFQVEGKWQHAFFKLQDQNGSDISTIDLDLNVLPNNVEMGITIHPFESDLEKVKAEINQALREMGAQQLLNQIDSMKSTVGAYTDLIARNQIMNKPDTINLINDQVAQKTSGLSSEVDNKVSSMQSQVESSVDKLKAEAESNGWQFKNIQATLINGTTGWGAGQLLWNKTVYVARFFGYIVVHGSNFFVDFMTNPFNGVIDFSNSTLTGEMMMEGSTEAGTKGYSRLMVPVQMDKGSQNSLGIFTAKCATGADVYGSSDYGGFLNLTFTGPSYQLHNV